MYSTRAMKTGLEIFEFPAQTLFSAFFGRAMHAPTVMLGALHIVGATIGRPIVLVRNSWW